MPDFDRRTYLKGAIASTVAVTGGAGVVFANHNPDHEGGGPPGQEDPETPPGQEDPGEKVECRPPNVLLAKYEWDDDEGFVFEEGVGDQDTVEFTILTDKDGEPIEVKWQSEVPVCEVIVKAGTEFFTFDGGFGSGIIDVNVGDEELNQEDKAISNVVFCERPAQAILCQNDLDSNGGDHWFQSHMHLEQPTSGSGLDGVVHVTSHGVATSDYASGMVNIARQDLTVDSLQGSSPTSILYDFYIGEGDDDDIPENAMPDEVFFVLETPDQEEKNQDPKKIDEFTVAYRTGNSAATPESWYTRDVTTEAISGNFTLEEATDDENIPHDWHTTVGEDSNLQTSGAILNLASGLRASTPSETDLTSFADANILAVGFGQGYTTALDRDIEVELDGYYDDLSVGDMDYEFPAAVPMTVGNVETTGDSMVFPLEFESGQDEEGLEYGNVVGESVKLNDLADVAPPPEDGVKATSVTVKSDRIEAAFPKDDVTSGVVVVSGDFDLPQVISFVATTEVSE